MFVLGKRLGCLEEPMPENCRLFVDSIRGMLQTTGKVMVSLPLHEYFKTKDYKKLMKHTEDISILARGYIHERIEEVDTKSKDEEGDGEDDFLSHMIHSGKMSVDEIATNAVDLMAAGVDTVCEMHVY